MMQVFDNQGNLKQKSLVTSGVNSVTATPPLFSTGGSAPDISIALATALSDGYLSSVDWSTFNNKQNALTLTTIGSSGAATLIGATLNIPQYTDQYLGTVTSVGLSAGTGISIGGTNPVTSSGTISVTNTAPDQIVALTAGTGIGVSGTYPNFTITNSAPSPAGAITGTGTSGQVAYWTGTSSQSGSNNLFWDAANNRLGIGTNAPSYRLHVVGPAVRFQNAGSFELDLFNSTGNVFLRLTAGATAPSIGTIQNIPLNLFMNGTVMAQITSTNGNLILQNGGTFTDGGQRLQVNGDALIKGSGNTSATTALTVQNSDGNALLSTRNDGTLFYGPNNQRGFLAITDALSTLGAVTLTSQSNLTISNSRVSSVSLPNGSLFITRDGTETSTVSSTNLLIIGHTASTSFAPTSGNALFTTQVINSRINQTGGANGITRGLYVNPTLTAAADWRSIEWSNNSGWGLYGAGSANNYLAGNLGVGNTTPFSGATVSASVELGAFSANNGNLIVRGYSSLGGLANNGYGAVGSNYYLDASNALRRRNADLVSTLEFSSGFRFSTAGNGAANSVISLTELMRLNSNGNLLLGSTVDGGQKLQVTGTMNVTGNTTFGGTVAASGGYGVTSGTFNIISSSPNVVPTSGTLSINSMTASPTINQTGGANGITRGLYINPTLTAAADWRAIETTQGSLRMADTYLAGSGSLAGSLIDLTQTWNTTGSPTLIKANVTNTASGASSLLMDLQVGGVSQFQVTKNGNVGIGTSPSYKLDVAGTFRTQDNTYLVETGTGSVGINTNSVNASAILEIKSTAKGFLPPRMTNAQMVAIATPAAGLVVYDTTNNKLNVYDGTNWVTLH